MNGGGSAADVRAGRQGDVAAQPSRGVLAPLADFDGAGVAAQSLAAQRQLPGTRTASSSELGWRSVLVRAYVEPDHAEAFTTAPTPDLLLVINVRGTFVMESQRAGGWSTASYWPGAIGATAPGGSATLRWRSEGSSGPPGSVHLHLAAGLLSDTAAALGNRGLLSALPDALLLEDPFVLAAGRALLTGVEQHAEPLYADSMAHVIAMHLLYRRRLTTGSPRRPRDPGALSGQALNRVVEHMHDHLGDVVSLEDLAQVANVSKFHFLRLFRLATGVTPHRYLVRLRMQRAAELMRTSDHSVLRIAAVCGYASPGQFAGAFRRHHGTTPTSYRKGA